MVSCAVTDDQALSKHFQQSPEDLDINVVYDVSHNIAKVRAISLN